MPVNQRTRRIMHPIEVDTEVTFDTKALAEQPRDVVSSAVRKRAWEREAVRLKNTPVFSHDFRRGLVEGWTWCPELGEHEYEVSIQVDPFRPDLFTESEVVYGHKTLRVLQRRILSSS